MLNINFRNVGLEVDVGQRRVISSVALEAADLDTPPNKLCYFLNSEPRFGKLLLKVRTFRKFSLVAPTVFCTAVIIFFYTVAKLNVVE